jgi:putative phage-type endonuclease
MIIHNVEQRSDEWKMLRKGRVTGTGLKRIVGTKLVRDNFFYELLAERLSIGVPDDESAMMRGTRLEAEAREKYAEHIGKKIVVPGFLQSEENEFIGSSPDGYVESKKMDRACEIKCLSGANHIRAYIEKQIPKDYYPQGIQAFIVNENLKQLDFVFYDPRMPDVAFFTLPLTRKECEEDIANYRQQELDFLVDVEKTLLTIIK